MRLTRLKKRKGQTLTEFTIVMAMLLSVLVVMVGVLTIFSEWGWRILTLVGLESP